MSALLPNLFSEIEVGSCLVKNRIVSPGHHTYLCDDVPGDRLIAYHEARAKGCEKRIAILDRADTQQFSERALETWKYFRGHEEWIKLFHLAQKTGNIELMEETIRKYVEKASRDGGMTRGEKGILIQHNLKWLKHQQKNGKVDRNVGTEKGKL